MSSIRGIIQVILWRGGRWRDLWPTFHAIDLFFGQLTYFTSRDIWPTFQSFVLLSRRPNLGFFRVFFELDFWEEEEEWAEEEKEEDEEEEKEEKEKEKEEKEK